MKSLCTNRSTFGEIEQVIKNALRGLKSKGKYLTLSIKVQKNTPMGMITDIKQLLRDEFLLKVAYDLEE